MLIARVPIFPSHSQVTIGDYTTDVDTWPEWTDDELDLGVAASASMLYVSLADRSDFITVDIRDSSPTPSDIVIYEGTLRLGTVTIAAPGTTPPPILKLPDVADWKAIVTVNDRDQENIRHVTLHLPEYADPEMPDGAWMHI
ncbi:hypothetical protein ACOBQX_18060 [Actinokineospora sp. G85]|uniref:hypothetical protein n=1 Tax=Actinokineospora sp. G85 TaxID=3406626 RepID=UPI003C7220B8